jgi:hypothetical protein
MKRPTRSLSFFESEPDWQFESSFALLFDYDERDAA